MDDDRVLRLFWLLGRIYQRQELMMGALQDLQAADANLATEVDAILADVAALQTQITDLTTAASTAVAAADLQPQIDAVNATAAKIAAALAPPAPPAAADVPPVAPAPDAPLVSPGF